MVPSGERGAPWRRPGDAGARVAVGLVGRLRAAARLLRLGLPLPRHHAVQQTGILPYLHEILLLFVTFSCIFNLIEYAVYRDNRV